MKKLDRLILKSFIGPLVLTFAIAVFVLLMQFVWKYIDDMVGKGLEFKVIAELLFYASATFVPMALPIAVLFASIMTMGNFGEKYELVAMKAGGISVNRVMRPMAVVALLLTGVAFYFANNVMPTAMLRYRVILYDVARKKPAVNIRPSEYYKDIEGYVIRVDGKNSDDGSLQNIVIYDHSKAVSQDNVVVAKSGIMRSSPDERYLIFSLYNGYTYSELTDGENFRSRPLTTIQFDTQEITFDISSFAYDKTDGDFFKHSYQMLSVRQLDTAIAEMQGTLDRRYEENKMNIFDRMRAYRYYRDHHDEPCSETFNLQQALSQRGSYSFGNIQTQTSNIARYVADDIAMFNQILASDTEYLNRHYIEKQRKFTLSIACLLMFLIGAPFGSIVRKGGLGMPLVASVAFFVIYYVVGMIAEKAVRESALGPIGMWYSFFVMLPIGLLLTYQATTDASLFESAVWKRRLQKFQRFISRHLGN